MNGLICVRDRLIPKSKARELFAISCHKCLNQAKTQATKYYKYYKILQNVTKYYKILNGFITKDYSEIFTRQILAQFKFETR